MEQGLFEKTGKSLAEWIALVKQTNLQKHGEILKYLKSEHGLTHGYANLVSLKAREADAASSSPGDLIQSQYSGKAPLFPIYQAILEHVNTFGNDIEVVPKKANVSLRRKRQFALIQPSTKTRVDLGLKFNAKPIRDRLEGSGIFGAMCTHRVRISSLDEVDNELVSWLREAYQEAG